MGEKVWGEKVGGGEGKWERRGNMLGEKQEAYIAEDCVDVVS